MRWLVIHGIDVVDVAAVDGFVAAGGMLAVAIAHLDRPAHGADERPLPRHRQHRAGPVEQHDLDVGDVEVRPEALGRDDLAGGELAHVADVVVTDQHREERSRSPGALGRGGGAGGHLDQRGRPTLSGGAQGAVALGRRGGAAR